MSRGEASTAFKTAQSTQKTAASEAGTEFGAVNDSIKEYQDNLSKFVSSNPYTKGGEYDKTILPGLAATSDAGSSSLKGMLQEQSQRTGENAAGSAATAEEAARASTRDLATQEAEAEQNRIKGETTYNQEGLQAGTVPIQAQGQLFGTTTGASTGATGNMIGAANANKSFWDTLGDSFATQFGKTLGGGTGAYQGGSGG
jgi:hypothetical protein